MTDNNDNSNNELVDDSSQHKQQSENTNTASNQEVESVLQKLQTNLEAIDSQNAREINTLKLKESELLREISSYSSVLDKQYVMFSKQLQTNFTLRQKYLRREMDFLEKYVKITEEMIPLIKQASDNRKKPLTKEQQSRMIFLQKKETNFVDIHNKQYRNQYLQFIAYLTMHCLTGVTERRRLLVNQYCGQLKTGYENNKTYLLPNRQLRDELTSIRRDITSIRSDYNALRRDDQKNEMLYIRAMNQRELKRSESMDIQMRSKWTDLYKRRDNQIAKLAKTISLPDNWWLNADKKKWLQNIFNHLDF